MTRDPDPTPPHGIPRPPALAPTAIEEARGWLTAQDGDYLNEIGNGGVFDTLAQVLDLVEGFAASYFADDAHGVDLYAQEAGALSVFRACEKCRTWQDRADLDIYGLCAWCQDEEDEQDEDDRHPCEHGHLDCATRPGGDCWQEVTPSPWERVSDARHPFGNALDR
jgi:hypothetical protein